MTVDDFSEDGWYVDRRGWHWFRAEHQRGQWHHFEEWGEWHLTDAQMRVLIERDQHRRSCIGLSHCDEHPVASVVWGWGERQWIVFKPYGWENNDGIFCDHAAAMSAARALAVSE